MEPESKRQMPQIPGWVWWVFLVFLIAWNVGLFKMGEPSEVDIPYSTFIAQVRAGNVARVEIAGNEISGTFVQAIPVPESASAAAQTPTNAPQSTPVPPALYTEFLTTFPETVGDATLMSLLQAHGVVIDVAPSPSPWLTILVSNGLPLLLLVGVMVWMSRRASRNQQGLFGFGQTHARRYSGDRPQVTFADVAGADDAKAELQDVVDFLRHPAKYLEVGARIPRGILVVGHPGTGKTLMARAVAGEAEVPFFSLSASEFVEMFVGVGASRVRDLFAQAKAAAPAIIFIDELDAVGRRRGAGLGTVNDEREQTLNQLLVEMDGFDERNKVIVLAATNRPDVLDPALLRPGRFDRQVTVGLPDRQGREGILRIHTRELHLAPEVELGSLARATTGFSGADLANLCNEAALLAARRDHGAVTMADFEEALDKVLLGGVRPLLLDEHERQVIAYHEAGHALVAWFTPEADPVHKVTIIPRGRTLGVTEQMPEDHYNYGRSYLLTRLSVMLGGRAAEEVAVGDVTTGAENDLIEATRLARRMVTRWGMGNLGMLAFQADEEQPFLGYELAQGRDYSEALATRIDAEIERLLQERHDVTRRLLIAGREALDHLAGALLREETVDRDALERILGPRPEFDLDPVESASSLRDVVEVVK